MYFFKYQSVSPLSLMMLKRGEIYFASPKELNDRQECRAIYIYNGSEGIWLRFVDYVLYKVGSTLNEYRQLSDSDVTKLLSLVEQVYRGGFRHNKKRNLSISNIINCLNMGLDQVLCNHFPEYVCRLIQQHTKKFLQHTHQELNDMRYITSFSKNATNPTMWGHYAAAETGFLVIYRTQDNYVEVRSEISNLSGSRENKGWTEIGSYSEEKLELKTIQYLKSPCKVNGFSQLIHKFRYSEKEYQYDVPELLHCDIGKMQEDKIGMIKYSDWKYEQELRLFFPTYREQPAERRCAQIDANHIKGIIFGAQTSTEDKKKILIACSYLMKIASIDRDFAILQAIDSEEQYSLDIVPVGLATQFVDNDFLPIQPYQNISKDKQDFLENMCTEIISQH